MSWVLIVALALIVFLVVAFVFKAPRSGWEAVGAALLLGVAGYGLQGSPGMPSAPKASAEDASRDARALVEARIALSDSGIPPTNRWVVLADGLARNGRFAEAAEILRGAIADNPKDAEAWTALGNALIAHAEGMPTPAAIYAYDRAMKANPRSPAPRFFLGAAMAQSGQFQQARDLWAQALALAPKDAPYREGLAERLGQLDRFLTAQSRPGTPPPDQPKTTP